MSRFDAEVWKKRAIRRFNKTSALDRSTIGKRFSRDIDSIQKLENVIAWCDARKIAVNFGTRANGVYEPDKRKITVSGRLSPEHQLFVLLHECGHFLVGNRNPDQRFGRGYADDDNNTRRTTIHRVDVVDEELEAWHRGFKLATRLGIEININRYNDLRVQYVKSYLKWAVRSPPYKAKKQNVQKDQNNTVQKSSKTQPVGNA